MKRVLFILLTLILFFSASLSVFAYTRLRYNYMENKWEYADTKDVLRWNHMENEWQFVDPDARLVYNYMENKWEWVED